MIHFYIPLFLILLSFITSIFAVKFKKTWLTVSIGVLRLGYHLSLLHLVYFMVTVYDHNFGQVFDILDKILHSV